MFAGVSGTLIGLVWFAQRAHFELDAIATSFEVLEVRQELTNDRNVVYKLKLRRVDQHGDIHETVPGVWASNNNVPVGTELDIKYDPNDPADVRVESENGPWHLPRLFLFGSSLSFLWGWFTRRRAQT